MLESPSIMNESPAGLAAVARGLNIDGHSVSAQMLWRWCRKGLRGIRLEYLRAGRRIITSMAAVERFFRALANADAAPVAADALRVDESQITRPESQRARAIAEARRRLEAAGI